MAAECGVHRLVADVALFAAGQVLLCRYRDVKRYDGQRGWFLPDDFLNHQEHPEDAARRILKEQSGLAAPVLRLGHIESFGDGAWHLVFHFVADLDEPRPFAAGDNVAEMAWFRLGSLPATDDVAHHGWALDVIQE